jgi:hypothetical protein
MRDIVLFTVGFFSWMMVDHAYAKDSTQQECTAITVPKSVHLPVRMNGTLQKAPVEISLAFAEMINTVQLPRGFEAVGGGRDVVIACTK